MTEAEAIECWCPFARMVLSTNYPAAVNRDIVAQRAGQSVNCIASGCMAWRWDHAANFDRRLGTPQQGHCGLAGRP
jgi:hypothetical protein